MVNSWYDYFMEALFKKYPKRLQLAHALMDLLFIEREAAYRRLRRDVMFPINEIIKISQVWNISLDEIIGVNSSQVSFQMRQVNYLNPSTEELKYLKDVIQTIDNLKKHPNTEFMCICNKLPRNLLAGYKHLNQFYLFKWMYQYGNEQVIIPFSKIIASEEKGQLDQAYYQAIKQVPNTSFIWDNRIFEYLVSNIKYFHSIRMITDQEKDLIKEDLNALLSYMLLIANNGCYPETKNKVNLYISQLSVDTNYSYTFSPETKICFVHVFEKYDIYTLNVEMVHRFKIWMQQKKRSSIQITEVDERSRMEFFTKQQQVIDNL